MKHFLKRLRNRIQAIWAILTHRNYALAVVNRKHRWYCVNYHNPKYDKRTNALALGAVELDLATILVNRHTHFDDMDDMAIEDYIEEMQKAYHKVYGDENEPFDTASPQSE
jgi:hypothetical protein